MASRSPSPAPPPSAGSRAPERLPPPPRRPPPPSTHSGTQATGGGTEGSRGKRARARPTERAPPRAATTSPPTWRPHVTARTLPAAVLAPASERVRGRGAPPGSRARARPWRAPEPRARARRRRRSCPGPAEAAGALPGFANPRLPVAGHGDVRLVLSRRTAKAVPRICTGTETSVAGERIGTSRGHRPPSAAPVLVGPLDTQKEPAHSVQERGPADGAKERMCSPEPRQRCLLMAPRHPGEGRALGVLLSPHTLQLGSRGTESKCARSPKAENQNVWVPVCALLYRAPGLMEEMNLNNCKQGRRLARGGPLALGVHQRKKAWRRCSVGSGGWKQEWKREDSQN